MLSSGGALCCTILCNSGRARPLEPFPAPVHNGFMALSARNQFRGTVASIKSGSVMSEVTIDIGGGHKIVSLISSSSAKRLKLKKGSPAIAVIKATEVIVSTEASNDEA